MVALTTDHDGRIHQRHYKGGRSARDYHEEYLRKRITQDERPFIGWDGEGYTDEHGGHHYMLFGASTGDQVVHAQLRHRKVFDLLLRVAYENPRAIHVIFAGSYDAIMWCHLMPDHIVKRIMEGKPTRYDGYRIHYYKGKMFRLSSENPRRSITVYDVFSFFACSFVKACREYLGDDETLRHVEGMKLRRSTFDRAAMPEVIEYMGYELVYLVRLMENLRTRLITADIHLNMWHGPGAVASRVLADKGIQNHRTDDERVNRVSRHGYFGGRFEQFRVGRLDGQVWQYDIRSAYPFAAIHLPSLSQVRWRHRSKVSQPREYGIYHVVWEGPYGSIGPLPWRHSTGNIFYPSRGSGWYWGIEVSNLVTWWPDEWWSITEGFEPYGPGLKVRPFAWVEDYYEKRAELKRKGDPAQLAYKLALNSVYGKLAQSRGAELINGVWRKPRWHQLEWAGWITAKTRAMMFDTMMRAGSSLIAVETDAVFTTAPIEGLEVGERLGQWDRTTYTGILYLQSGVYFTNRGDDPSDTSNGWICKTRGFEPRNHTYQRWLSYCSLCPDSEPGLRMSTHRFGTVPNSTHYARWYDHVRDLRLDGLLTKRAHYGLMCPECDSNAGSYADVMHHLVVPEPIIPVGAVSAAHSLPWAQRDESLSFDDDDLILDVSIDW